MSVGCGNGRSAAFKLPYLGILTLITNSNSQTHFRLMPKSKILDDLKRPLRTIALRACFFGIRKADFSEDRATLTAAI